eukprot:9341515-Pyramimonas_sp.AAC.1
MADNKRVDDKGFEHVVAVPRGIEPSSLGQCRDLCRDAPHPFQLTAVYFQLIKRVRSSTDGIPPGGREPAWCGAGR